MGTTQCAPSMCWPTDIIAVSAGGIPLKLQAANLDDEKLMIMANDTEKNAPALQNYVKV